LNLEECNIIWLIQDFKAIISKYELSSSILNIYLFW